MKTTQSPALPPLPFGEKDACPNTDIDAYRESMATVIPSIQSYEAIGDPLQFRQKAKTLTLQGLKLVASANTPVTVAVGDTHDTTLMIPFVGRSVSTIGRKTYLWQPGESAMFFPGMGRSGDSSTRSTLMLNLDPERLQTTAQAMVGLEADAVVDLGLLNERLLPLRHQHIAFDTALLHICRLIDSQPSGANFLTLLGLDDLFYRMVVLMLRPDLLQAPEVSPSRTPNAQMLHKVADFIQARLDAPVPLSDLERVSGLSARTLHRHVRQEFGCSPRQWIQQQRLDRVQQCLAQASPADTVTNIALDCGFTRLGAFAKAYAARFGELPSATLARARRR